VKPPPAKVQMYATVYRLIDAMKTMHGALEALAEVELDGEMEAMLCVGVRRMIRRCEKTSRRLEEGMVRRARLN
jgi:hypothetical protein